MWADRHPCDTKTVHKQTFGLNEGHVTNNEDVIRVRHLQATLAGPGMGLDETYWQHTIPFRAAPDFVFAMEHNLHGANDGVIFSASNKQTKLRAAATTYPRRDDVIQREQKRPDKQRFSVHRQNIKRMGVNNLDTKSKISSVLHGMCQKQSQNAVW